MMGKRHLIRWAAALLAVLSMVSCGVETETSAGSGDEATVFVNSCSLLSKKEAEHAVGVPLGEPTLYPDEDNTHGNSCDRGNARLASVSTYVDGTVMSDQEADEYQAKLTGEGYALVQGVGRWAVIGDEGPHNADLEGISTEGVYFTVNVAHREVPLPELKRRATKLAKVVIKNLTRLYPGRSEDLPTVPPFTTDPCDLSPTKERVEITGWAAKRELDDIAGPLRGTSSTANGTSHSCGYYRGDGEVLISIILTDQPTKLPAKGRAEVKGLGRPAVFEPPVAKKDALCDCETNSTLSVQLADGRLLEFLLFQDDLGAQGHKKLLSALAKLALEQLPS